MHWAAAWLASLLVQFCLRVIQSELLVLGTRKSYTDPRWMSTVDIVVFVFILGLKIIFLHGKPTFFLAKDHNHYYVLVWAESVKIKITA